MKALLKLLGYEIRKPSLILMHMIDVTHESWLATIQRQNKMIDYTIKN